MSAIKHKLKNLYRVLSDVRFQQQVLKDLIFLLVVVLVAEGLKEAIKEGIPIGLSMIHR